MRKLNVEDVRLAKGFRLEVYAQDIDSPVNMLFSETGEMYVADAGVVDGIGKVIRKTTHGFEVFATGFTTPVTGIAWHQGYIYVSHRGRITRIDASGKKEDVLSGLPSHGDHTNNQVVFGPDDKMYFGQGTATNSGVVGSDNKWVNNHASFHDYPASGIVLNGQNFQSRNVLANQTKELAFTGAYSPFGVPVFPGERIKGIIAASGSILRANPDGSELELVAWGLRNPFRLRFDDKGRLFSTNHGMDERGSRPIAECPDEIHRIREGAWYGWPDYSAGYPVHLPQHRPEGRNEPTFLLANHPMRPPLPVVTFAPHSAIGGFVFNPFTAFGEVGSVFIAEFGSEAPATTGGKPAPEVGHRISRVNFRTGKVSPFAINNSGIAASESGSGGLERPVDVAFGPDGAMYIADMGINTHRGFEAKSGVIWRLVPPSSR